jgi:hypothetical protein
LFDDSFDIYLFPQKALFWKQIDFTVICAFIEAFSVSYPKVVADCFVYFLDFGKKYEEMTSTYDRYPRMSLLGSKSFTTTFGEITFF